MDNIKQLMIHELKNMYPMAKPSDGKEVFDECFVYNDNVGWCLWFKNNDYNDVLKETDILNKINQVINEQEFIIL